MRKTKVIAIAIISIILACTMLNCIFVGSVNAAEEVTINKIVTSTNGTVEFEIKGLEIESGNDYQWGISKTKGSSIEKWNDVLAPDFSTKTIKITVDSSEYLDILKSSDEAYVSVRKKDETTNLLNEEKVDLSLPLGKSYNIVKSKWYNNRTVLDNPAFSITSVYGIEGKDIQYSWEKITDENIVNNYIDNNHDLSGLNLKGKEGIPNSSSTTWKSITEISSYSGTRGLKNNQLPVNDGLYYLWLKNTSSDIKTVYGQVVIEIGEVTKITNNTEEQGKIDDNNNGNKTDDNNENIDNKNGDTSKETNDNEKNDGKDDGKDETTADGKIPQTGQSLAIVAVIAVFSATAFVGFKFSRKNRDIK